MEWIKGIASGADHEFGLDTAPLICLIEQNLLI